MHQRVACSDCGHEFSNGYAAGTEREPCPDCGSRGLAIEIHVTDELNVTTGMSVGVGPSVHDRTPARRWSEAAAGLALLEQPLPNAQEATLLDAQRRLHHVLIDLWALREAVTREGVARQIVDSAIKSDSLGMALTHDLGNVAKHGPLKNPPISSDKPIFGKIMAERPGSGGSWRFRAVIRHGQHERDGLEVTRNSVDNWEHYLQQWNLL